jgi:hypothetical protein
MRAARPVTRRSTASSIADDLGEFYEPGDPGNPVRLKTWYLFIAEVFKLKDTIIAGSLRKLVPLYKQDPTSDVIDKAIDQWIQLFHFPIQLIMTGANICVSEFLVRLAIEILRYWARNARAAKRFEVPPRPATWTWGKPSEEQLSTIRFPAQAWRFRVEKRTEFERRAAAEQKRLLAERLDEIESQIVAMKSLKRTPGIRLGPSSHVHWAARIQVLGDMPRESERPGVMKGARHVFKLMGINPMKRRGRPGRK